MTDFRKLNSCIRKGEVTLFLGSGFSFKAGAPSASDISHYLVDSMEPSDRENLGSNRDLDYISYEFELMYGRKKLLDVLKEAMAFTPMDMSDHESLRKIPHIRSIITTNYDTLIEDTYGDEMYVARNTKDCVHIPTDKVILYKIHGDFSYKENLIVTKQDYTDFFANRREPMMWNHIISEILTRDILFIGYSLEDSNIFEIMKAIKKSVNGETRNFFLIAPGLQKHKIDRLAQANVTYYDAKAEDFFPVLFASLDKHIACDYRNKRISTSVFTKYCKYHNLKPCVSEDDSENSIKGIKSLEESVNSKFVFTLPKDLASDMMNQNPKAYSAELPIFGNSLDNSFCNVPIMKFNKSQFKKANFTLNGLTISDMSNIESIMVLPAVRKKKISVRIPEINFNEKTEISHYTFNKELHIVFDFNAFTFQIIMTAEKKSRFELTLKETYEDNIEALKWINFPIAFFEGKLLFLSLFGGLNLKLEKPQNVEEYYDIRQYFKNINDIEIYYGIDFTSYERYSPQTLEQTVFLLAVYNEKVIPKKLEKLEVMIAYEGSYDDAISRFHIGDKTCFITSYEPEEVVFNHQSVILKPRCCIIPSCTILSIKKQGSKGVEINIRLDSDTFYEKYSYTYIDEIKKQTNISFLI